MNGLAVGGARLAVLFRKLVVEGFRALQGRVEVPLKSITILTGRNNTGKSSLLEALAIASSALNGFRDGLGRDVFRQIVQSKKLNWNLLVNTGSQHAAIALETINDNIVSLEIKSLEKLDVDQIKPPILDSLAKILSKKTEVQELLPMLRSLLWELRTSLLDTLEFERMLKYLEMFLPTVIATLSSTTLGTEHETSLM